MQSSNGEDNVFVHVKVAVQQSVMPEFTELAMYKLDNVSGGPAFGSEWPLRHAQIESYVADVVRSLCCNCIQMDFLKGFCKGFLKGLRLKGRS